MKKYPNNPFGKILKNTNNYESSKEITKKDIQVRKYLNIINETQIKETVQSTFLLLIMQKIE